MAQLEERLPENVTGEFFVDSSCIDCDACRQIAPASFHDHGGKSSVYRSLHLLADAALNSVVASLAREGGLPSTFWAGPETIARSVRQGTHDVEPLAKRSVASLKLGFGSDTYSYSIDLGYPPPPPKPPPPKTTMFTLDPHIKRECIWHGPLYRKASALVDRRNNFVWLSTTRDSTIRPGAVGHCMAAPLRDRVCRAITMNRTPMPMKGIPMSRNRVN